MVGGEPRDCRVESALFKGLEGSREAKDKVRGRDAAKHKDCIESK